MAGSERTPIELLAATAIEDTGESRAPFDAALGDPDLRIWAAIALARLGDFGPLDAVVEELRGGAAPAWMADEQAAYERLRAVRPLPGPVRAHLRGLDGAGPPALRLFLDALGAGRPLGLESAEPPPAAEPQPVPAAEPEPRRLQVEVVETGLGRRRRHALAPDSDHEVGVLIGPGGAGLLEAAAAFPDADVAVDPALDGAVLQVLFFVGESEPIVRRLLLPTTGPTAQVRFPLRTGAAGTLVRFGVHVMQGTRTLQSAEFVAPVAAEDAPVGGETLRVERETELASTPGRPGPADLRPSPEAALNLHLGAPGQGLLVRSDGPPAWVDFGHVDEQRRAIVTLLLDAVNVDDVDGARYASEQQVALLRGLARQGNLMYQPRAAALAPLGDTPRLQLVTATDDVAPLEFLYDYGFPSRTATLCADWQDGCRCRRREGQVRKVCPLGFWGVRKVIERQVAVMAEPAGQARPDRPALRALTDLVFAASGRVDRVSPGETERTIARFAARLGSRFHTADSWTEWRTVVRDHQPAMLLTLPHNEEGDDGLGILEIGRRSRLDVGAVTREYVHAGTADPGPVVLLLGCNTDIADLPWQSAVAAFRRNGAALVIGTLVGTLGRQTAPMARVLADALWEERTTTFGEAMQQVRRRLLAEGYTLAMSLVAYGDADWVLEVGP